MLHRTFETFNSLDKMCREVPWHKKLPGVGFSVSHTQFELYLVQEPDIKFILDINLPLCAICFALVLFFLKVRTPPGSVKDKLSKIDWL